MEVKGIGRRRIQFLMILETEDIGSLRRKLKIEKGGNKEIQVIFYKYMGLLTSSYFIIITRDGILRCCTVQKILQFACRKVNNIFEDKKCSEISIICCTFCTFYRISTFFAPFPSFHVSAPFLPLNHSSGYFPVLLMKHCRTIYNEINA
jgi:hypothetical protein